MQDASQGAGQIRPVNSGKLLVECRLRGRLPIPVIDQIVPVRDLVVHRTPFSLSIVTKRNTAIHAPAGLIAQRLLRQRNDEFAVAARCGRRPGGISCPGGRSQESLSPYPYFLLRSDATACLELLSRRRIAAICAASISAKARRYSVGMTLTNFGRYSSQFSRISAARLEPV